MEEGRGGYEKRQEKLEFKLSSIKGVNKIANVLVKKDGAGFQAGPIKRRENVARDPLQKRHSCLSLLPFSVSQFIQRSQVMTGLITGLINANKNVMDINNHRNFRARGIYEKRKLKC